MKTGITYSKQQREYAKKHGRSLVAVSACGVTFTGSVPPETAKALLEWMTEHVFKKEAGGESGMVHFRVKCEPRPEMD